MLCAVLQRTSRAASSLGGAFTSSQRKQADDFSFSSERMYSIRHGACRDSPDIRRILTDFAAGPVESNYFLRCQIGHAELNVGTAVLRLARGECARSYAHSDNPNFHQQPV